MSLRLAPTATTFAFRRTFSTPTALFAASAAVARAPPKAAAYAHEEGEERELAAAPESLEDAPGKTYASIESSLNPRLYRAITAKPFGYSTMSAVQEAVLSLLPQLADPVSSALPPQDLLVRARTGTGKTLGFLIPALEGRLKNLAAVPVKDLKEVSMSTVGAVIISPTRELASQIANEARMLATHLPAMRNGVHLFVGGESKQRQLKDFRRGTPDIIVATPGRLVDLLTDRMVREAVASSRMLILDEADTLLDMGFSSALEDITGHLPPPLERQTFLFSATVSPAIRRIAKEMLNPAYVQIDTVGDSAASTHDHVPQHLTVVPSATPANPTPQISHLVSLIKADQEMGASSKIVVFLPTTRQTQLFSLLLRPLLPSTKIFEIHSKKEQSQRSRASAAFRAARGPSILVTSDVSARGVDYPGVTRVIQVGAPATTESYIHRVGRTGRAGKDGRGDLIISDWEQNWVKKELKGINLVKLEPQTSREVEEHVASVLPSVDSQTIQEVFASLLGYYVPRARDFATTPERVIEGLQSWTVGMGLQEGEATVSRMMLQKLGVKSNGGGGRGGGGGGRGGYGGSRGDRDGDRSFSRGDRSFSRSDDRDGFRPRSFDRDSKPRSFDRDSKPRSFDRDDKPRSFDRDDKPRSFSSSREDRPRSFSRDDKPRRRERESSEDAGFGSKRGRKPTFGHSAATKLWEADSWEGKRGSF